MGNLEPNCKEKFMAKVIDNFDYFRMLLNTKGDLVAFLDYGDFY